MFPNEQVYQRVGGITLSTASHYDGSEAKVQGGLMILTTHRILYSDSTGCCEIPLSFVAQTSTGGGMFYSHRVEVNLDKKVQQT